VTSCSKHITPLILRRACDALIASDVSKSDHYSTDKLVAWVGERPCQHHDDLPNMLSLRQVVGSPENKLVT